LFLQFLKACAKLSGMTQPLALVLYERILPGSQLVNRLQEKDLNYRVQTLSEASKLVECALQAKPMVVLADLDSSRNDVCPALAQLRANPATQHLPVIAIYREESAGSQAAAQAAGATLIVAENAILEYLPQLLQQALQVE
jgi:CheY-like chemotaxis protein